MLWAEEKAAEKIDFSNVKIEPLFEEMIDSDTFAALLRAERFRKCEAVPKSKKFLKFTLMTEQTETHDLKAMTHSRVLRRQKI